MSGDFLLAIDQGTTSTRAVLFDAAGRMHAVAQRELPQIFPQPGWVEHDAEHIFADTVAVVREVLARAGVGAPHVASLGITNQRETSVVWERATGRPLGNAIVWQDRRTAAHCATLKAQGHEPMVRARTGLLLDPYFSGTKLAWMLDHRGLRARAENGELCFGTIDSFLLWRLTGGVVHATDATNASRTLLLDIRTSAWDEELCRLLTVPRVLLPDVRDCAGTFGVTAAGLFDGEISIGGMAGDQQAALVGQACFKPGMVKSTYGTGCFALMNTGETCPVSEHGLLSTIAYRIGGATMFALEGSIFIAGAVVQWLRDKLRVIASAADTEAIVAQTKDTGGVYLVPAFAGLGAPYWQPEARAALVGLTRDSGIGEIVRAALEAQGYQTRDLLTAMAADAGAPLTLMRIDGGMVKNDWVCQFLADMTGVTVERPQVTETTALGAALLAGLGAGIFPTLEDAAAAWRRDRAFAPQLAEGERERLYRGWKTAVSQTLAGT
jgi:glycerol kinase